jgi:hypothetical protein
MEDDAAINDDLIPYSDETEKITLPSMSADPSLVDGINN